MCNHSNTYIKKVKYSSQKKQTTVKYKCDDCGKGATYVVNHQTKYKKVFGDWSVFASTGDSKTLKGVKF